MKKTNNEKSGKNTVLPVICALIALVASAAYLALRTMQIREFDRKWGDYDDCGV